MLARGRLVGSYSRLFARYYTSTPEEALITQKLTEALAPGYVKVTDVSGGCGSMFTIDIRSPHFKGKSMVQQHKLVNRVLADDIKRWHGLQLRTKAE
ncbi:AaceriADR398Wp [[Ashbya] aceris (nom. inval.)]|nr:AaceriADR398Wp [[Ashbya] aceris (nom. inval.)]